MSPGSTAPIIAAVITKKRRKIFEAFRASSATSAANGKSLTQVGVKESILFRIQVRRKVIVELPEGRYFLDEARLAEVDRLRHRLVAIPIAAFLVSILLLIFFLRQ